jgi:hypothetical protein
METLPNELVTMISDLLDMKDILSGRGVEELRSSRHGDSSTRLYTALHPPYAIEGSHRSMQSSRSVQEHLRDSYRGEASDPFTFSNSQHAHSGLQQIIFGQRPTAELGSNTIAALPPGPTSGALPDGDTLQDTDADKRSRAIS